MKMKNLARRENADTLCPRMLNAEEGWGVMWECGERMLLLMLLG
jgi:hypothetical protein